MHRHFIRAHCIFHLLLLLAWAGPAQVAGQRSYSPRLPEGTLVGASVGRFLAGGGSLTSVALHVTELRHTGGGLDLTLATSPYLLTQGLGAVAADVGVAFNLAQPGVSFLPKLGGSLLAGTDGAHADAALGFHAGAALLVRTGVRTALRIEVVEHRYLEFPGQSILSVGIGLSGLPDPQARPE